MPQIGNRSIQTYFKPQLRKLGERICMFSHSHTSDVPKTNSLTENQIGRKKHDQLPGLPNPSYSYLQVLYWPQTVRKWSERRKSCNSGDWGCADLRCSVFQTEVTLTVAGLSAVPFSSKEIRLQAVSLYNVCNQCSCIKQLWNTKFCDEANVAVASFLIAGCSLLSSLTPYKSDSYFT